MKKINLLDKDLFTNPNKKRFLHFLYPVALVGILFFIFLYNVISADEGIFKYFARNLKTFTPNDDKIIEEVQEDNRVNILLLGHGGYGHDGPLLTDSIHVVSIDKDAQKATMISIPRDLLVAIPDYGKRKINHAYALTEQDSPGSGGLIASQVVEDVLDIEIDYYTTINFSGFIRLIDDLGGIDVNVPHGFIDNQYPDDNYEYQTVVFKKGWQTMDGDTALKFARSRHGICTTACEQGEGSDFARAKRQQIILKAVKDKMLSSKTWKSPKNVYKILQAYNKNIQTNIALWDIKEFYDLAKETDTSDIKHFVINDGPQGLLQARNINGAYVLVPKAGLDNYDQIHLAVDNLLYPKEIMPIETTEDVFVEIQNGTLIGGFASEIANKLEINGIKITKVSNAVNQNTAQTIIYDFTHGQKPEIIKAIQSNLPGSKISVTIPEEIAEQQQEHYIIKVNNTPIPTERKTDFLIILGSDLYTNLGLVEQ